MKNKGNQKKPNVFSTLRSIDYFGERVNFQIEGGESHKTIFGSICTILVFVLICAYTN